MKKNSAEFKSFVQTHKELDDKFTDIVLGFDDNVEIDWRDNREVEIHDFVEDPMDLINQLNSVGLTVLDFDFRYSETLRINFKNDFYYSFGLEDMDQEQIDVLLG